MLDGERDLTGGDRAAACNDDLGLVGSGICEASSEMPRTGLRLDSGDLSRCVAAAEYALGMTIVKLSSSDNAGIPLSIDMVLSLSLIHISEPTRPY